ncbi:hypothetical protein ACOMHN_017094 [Nucella lapillus]
MKATTGSGPNCWSSRRCNHCNLWFERRAARARIVSGNRAAAARVGTSFASCSATSGSGSGRWSARRCDNCNLWFERRAITRATTVSGRRAAAALVGARGRDVITKREITAQTRHHSNRDITTPQLASCSATTGSGPGCWSSRRCDHCNLWFERRAARARIVSGNRAAAARVGTSFASCSATSGSGSGRWSARRCDICNLWFERRAITRATTVSGRRATAALVGARGRDVITKREITAQTRHHRNRAITTPQPEARVQGGRLLICLLFGNDGLRARLLVIKKM